ncbi:MAG: copper resistance protein CopC [Gemmatimonadaceae bacterium]|nr:copper resistance protein CopC [Gemmatimonadaceae bacterium]NUP55319.1 copper resistance protein CopC [Gemmatimonadaceae bacterium]NUR35220.1 copper resistance protein CopC [Gemmatimonadaceae bacterium]NUS47719.1 copper resistance protein CopC [Gemmatimonadaceae bacterium]
MRKALAKLLVAITLLSSAPAPLWAHAALKRSTPAAGAHLAQVPTVLRLDFTETLELNFASLRLVSSSGREIALGPLAYAPDSRRSLVASVKGAMDAGTYVVMWQVAGDDGHSVRGRFEFVVAPGAMGTNAAPGRCPVCTTIRSRCRRVKALVPSRPSTWSFDGWSSWLCSSLSEPCPSVISCLALCGATSSMTGRARNRRSLPMPNGTPPGSGRRQWWFSARLSFCDCSHNPTRCMVAGACSTRASSAPWSAARCGGGVGCCSSWGSCWPAWGFSKPAAPRGRYSSPAGRGDPPPGCGGSLLR